MRRKLVSISTFNRFRLHRFVGCLLLLSLVALSTPGCTSVATQSDAKPPCAKIIYSNQNAGGDWQLRVTQWPNVSMQNVALQATGHYKPGTEIRTPRFSPNGSTVVFVGNRQSETGQETRALDPLANVGLDLWLLDIKKSTARPLSTDGAGYESPQWSPDGRSVIAISDNSYLPSQAVQEWKTALYAWDATSGKKSLLAKNVGTAIWSPNGDRIYFDKTDETGFYSISRNGGKALRFLVPKCEAILGGWSPDGKWFAYFDGGQLTITDKAQKQSVNLGLQENATALKWSPDGSRIALARSSSGKPDTAVLVVVNIEQRKERVLWSAKGTAEVISWSRNGNWIVVSHTKPESMFDQQLVAAPLAQKDNITLVSPTTGTFGFDWLEIGKCR